MNIQRVFSSLAAFMLVLTLCGGSALAANLFGGNRIYGITVSDGTTTTTKCGSYAVYTGPDHPAGAQLPMNLLQNGVFPAGLGATILHSYHSGRSYHNWQFVTACSAPLCVPQIAGPPEVETVVRDGVDVGFILSWTFDDDTASVNGPRVRLTQELVVEGPADGSETIDNSVVRETHTVENLGPGGFRFSLRKRWDLQVGSDYGPWLGSCDDIEAACDRSLNLTKDGTLDGRYPSTIVFNPSPARAACPAGIEPLEAKGCGGAPEYLVVASVAPDGPLSPRPSPPQRLQFNGWELLGAQECQGVAPLFDSAECGDDPLFEGTQLTYFYSDRLQNAIRLGPGKKRSFTQYLAASLPDRCPRILTGD